MRKLLTILALLCLLFFVGGYHLLYEARLAEAKSAVKKGLLSVSKADLTQLVFSTSGFAALNWEESDEFRYRDVMYDVVEVEKIDGQIICWCFADGNETALVNQYVKTQSPSSDKSPSQSLVKLLKLPFLPVNTLQHDSFSFTSNRIFPSYFPLLSSLETSVLTPPPKRC